MFEDLGLAGNGSHREALQSVRKVARRSRGAVAIARSTVAASAIEVAATVGRATANGDGRRGLRTDLAVRSDYIRAAPVHGW